MRSIIKFFLGFIIVGKISAKYIDPNTGGMLFQFLAVAFALLSTVFLFFSGQIKAVFSRLKRSVRERGFDEDNISVKNSSEDAMDLPEQLS